MIAPAARPRSLALVALLGLAAGCGTTGKRAPAPRPELPPVTWTEGARERLALQTQVSAANPATRTLYIEGGKIVALDAPPPAWAKQPKASLLVLADGVARPLAGLYGDELFTTGELAAGMPATLAVFEAEVSVSARAPLKQAFLVLVDGRPVYGTTALGAAFNYLAGDDVSCKELKGCGPEVLVCGSPASKAKAKDEDEPEGTPAKPLAEAIYVRGHVCSDCSCNWATEQTRRLDALPRGTWRDRWSFVLLQTALSVAAIAAVSYDAALVAGDRAARDNARGVFWWSLAAAVPSGTWWLVEDSPTTSPAKKRQIEEIDQCLAICPPPGTGEGL